MMYKYKVAILLFFCVCIFFINTVNTQSISPETILEAQMQDAQSLNISIPLYFRYRNTGYLVREMREIYVPRTMSADHAIINAVLDGPGSLSPYLSSLFPPGTESLNITTDGETLFVTFNEKLMGRYSDEALVFNAEYSKGEGLIRRQLAMASLVNTITENSDFTRVQVLVRKENYVSSSMRLSNRYYLLDEDSLPPPLTRQEEFILTPQVSVKIFLEEWQRREFAASLKMVRGSTNNNTSIMPTEYELQQMFSSVPRLADFNVTPGIISLDGQSAIVTISLTILRDDGEERIIQNRPLRLFMRDGIFIIPYETFEQLLKVVK